MTYTMLASSRRGFLFSDFSSYDSDKSFDGGSYAFYISFTPQIRGDYKVMYSSSAGFSYCPRIGVFQDCSNCDHCPAYDRTSDPLGYLDALFAVRGYPSECSFDRL